MHSCLLCAFLIFLLSFLLSSLSIPFYPSNSLSLFGDAQFSNNSITLTQETSCLSSSNSSNGIGRAFYDYPVRFLDISSNVTASFSCKFSFTITSSSPSCPLGDGIAFFITSNSGFFSVSNGYMGLPNEVSDPQDSYIAVEFDTYYDSSLGDINGNHIGIDANTILSLDSVDVTSLGFDLKSGKKMTAWIEYRDSSKKIKVWLGEDYEARPPTPVLESEIDLSKHLKEFMHVGFSASNGRGSAVHVVDQWRFKTSGVAPSTLPVETVQEEECLVCWPGDTGEDDQVSDFRRRDKREVRLALGLGGLALFVIFVLGILCFYYVFVLRRKGMIPGECNEGQSSRFQGSKVPRRLSLSEIRSATRGFNQNKIIGEGASAVVYEGALPSCGTVAVKRFSEVKQKGNLRNPFSNEFGTMAGCLRHKNLVQLQGWCCEKNELVLVYEYMPNGSLDRILHLRTHATKLLTWERRLNIILGVASALVYLHEDCERLIIHRDVKTCNIMLDADLNAKLGDFGLAEVYEHSCRTRDATLPAGTMGYLAPEYVYSGVPTVKTDVYSFGVVVLEVVSGRRPVDDNGVVLADWVWDLWEKGTVGEAVDHKLIGRYNKVEMERVLVVGLSCVHPNSKKRPTVKEAARMMKGEMPLPNLPAKKPTVKFQSVLPKQSEELLRFGHDEVNDTPWATPKTHFSRF
ncbi:hypothetical protein ACET3Z_010265 [Daucus carota]